MTLKSDKWDFEMMEASIDDSNSKRRFWRQDRWFNPFWSIWLQHLMSRPSCYECKFATRKRVADITLGDLWGVHLYCPELYGKNGGCSVAFCNTEKGLRAMETAKKQIYGHPLPIETAIRYQGPMRNHIKENPKRESFMAELKRPSLKLLFQKYVWGNRQKVWWWSLWHRI